MSAVEGARAALDTNVLVYAHDEDAADKHEVAKRQLAQLTARGLAVVSVQVLNEFYWTVTRPYKPFHMDHVTAEAAVRDITANCTVEGLTPAHHREATRAVGACRLAFWDALIWAAAKSAGASIVYTEDFGHGVEVEGVRFVNPFRSGTARP